MSNSCPLPQPCCQQKRGINAAQAGMKSSNQLACGWELGAAEVALLPCTATHNMPYHIPSHVFSPHSQSFLWLVCLHVLGSEESHAPTQLTCGGAASLSSNMAWPQFPQGRHTHPWAKHSCLPLATPPCQYFTALHKSCRRVQGLGLAHDPECMPGAKPEFLLQLWLCGHHCHHTQKLPISTPASTPARARHPWS